MCMYACDDDFIRNSELFRFMMDLRGLLGTSELFLTSM
jgi:hypothetical protein